MVKFKKLVLRIWTGLCRRFFALPSANQLLWTLLTFIAFAIIVIEPRMKEGNYDWFDATAWVEIAKSSLVVVAAALFIKFREMYKHVGPKTFKERYEWTARRTKISRIVAELGRPLMLDVCQNDHEHMRRLREWTLECAASSAKDYLGLPDNEIVSATLVDVLGPKYNGADRDSMFISARTAKDMKVGHTHKKNKLVAFEAIDKSDVAVCHDTKRDKRWAGRTKHRYRTVIAFPITIENKACGSLCLESTKPYGFLGKSSDLNSLAQPFLSLLALTFPQDYLYLECDYDDKHTT